MDLVLASSSPRRRELLKEAGVSFVVKTSEIDESLFENERAEIAMPRLALAKARAVAELYPDCLVLGADTGVALNGVIYGKPSSSDDALRMLQELQGKTHQVVGGVAFVCLARGIEVVDLHVTEVKFSEMSEADIERYVATGEPLDKAGAYAIQGIGGCYIDAINGSYTNVVGLDIAATLKRIRELKWE